MFNKIESIDETLDRYDERAKLLLSGKKPIQLKETAKGKITFNNESNELKKILMISFNS